LNNITLDTGAEN